MHEFPGSLGKYTRYLEHSERRPARQGRPQRDLLPLPCPRLAPEDFSDEKPIDPEDLDSLQIRLRITVIALNWEAGYRHPKFAGLCETSPSAAQWAHKREVPGDGGGNGAMIAAVELWNQGLCPFHQATAISG